MIRRLRMWWVNREMERLLDDIGWPKHARSIFTGNVTVASRTFLPGASLADAIREELAE